MPTNVETPEIFTLSNSVCPSKSMAPDISRLAAVKIPVAFIFVISTPVECKKLSPILYPSPGVEPIPAGATFVNAIRLSSYL